MKWIIGIGAVVTIFILLIFYPLFILSSRSDKEETKAKENKNAKNEQRIKGNFNDKK